MKVNFKKRDKICVFVGMHVFQYMFGIATKVGQYVFVTESR